MERYEQAKQILKKYNQEHVLNFYNELSQIEKEKLINQILNIDFEILKNLYKKTSIKETKIDFDLKPMPYIDKFKLSEDEIKYYENIGIEAIKRGEYAAGTMAGGQGTRLGHYAPKGTYKLGVNPDKTLFEILCDTLKDANEKYGVIIPWYIMTSRDNQKDTIKYFEENNYLGYPKDAIKFFNQGEMPMILENGQVILNSKSSVKEAPDGHGGVLEALYVNKMIDDMNQRGVKWIFIGGVDNVLVKMIDPLLVGLAIDKNMKMAGKSIVKAYPEERVGVFCKKDNRPSVIEYTEISKELSELRDEKGELAYGESHILCNLFSVEILQHVSKVKLPYHIAHKKSNYIDTNGNEIIPEAPNAYKFESFIFDAFEEVDDMLILRVKREEEFAPVKNAEGTDSPETARKLYNDYWNK